MPVACAACETPLPAERLAGSSKAPCPGCRRPLRALAFPALYRPPGEALPSEPAALGDEATCFTHPARRAAVVCDACGRFLCRLCHLDLGDRHICPSCLDAGMRKGTLPLETQRVVWDRLALGLAVVPMLLFVVPTIVGAPLTLVVVWWKWRAPGSLVRGARASFVVAAGLALLQVAGWMAFLAAILWRA